MCHSTRVQFLLTRETLQPTSILWYRCCWRCAKLSEIIALLRYFPIALNIQYWYLRASLIFKCNLNRLRRVLSNDFVTTLFYFRLSPLLFFRFWALQNLKNFERLFGKRSVFSLLSIRSVFQVITDHIWIRNNLFNQYFSAGRQAHAK